MQNRYIQQMEQIQMKRILPKADSEMFENISEQQLLQISHFLFSFFLHDEYNKKFRKMLMINNFIIKKIGSIYIEQYFNNPIHFQETIFSSLICSKVMKEWDTNIMAIHFYAPIQFLLTLCDAQPGREEEAYLTLKKTYFTV